MQRHEVLDKGYVQLLDTMGSDLAIVNAARTSFDSESVYHHYYCEKVAKGGASECECDGSEGDAWLAERDAGLIGFLMKNRHGTPFEMVNLKFAVKAPIFVFREWHRHRMASINEMSGRYVELEREFYVPGSLDVREQKGKPGSYYYEPVDDWRTAQTIQSVIAKSSNDSFDAYEAMLKAGIAKEVARLVLPVNTYSKMVWSVNLRGLLNFLSLRNHDHAQAEIRYYAKRMEMIAEQVAPVTMKAFVDNGRIAP